MGKYAYAYILPDCHNLWRHLISAICCQNDRSFHPPIVSLNRTQISCTNMTFSRVINNEWTPEIKLLFQTYHYGIIPYQLPRLSQSFPISELFIMGLGFHFQQKVLYDIGSQTIYGRLPSGQLSTEVHVLIFPLNGYYRWTILGNLFQEACTAPWHRFNRGIKISDNTSTYQIWNGIATIKAVHCISRFPVA